MEIEISEYFDFLLELEDDWCVKKIETHHICNNVRFNKTTHENNTT